MLLNAHPFAEHHYISTGLPRAPLAERPLLVCCYSSLESEASVLNFLCYSTPISFSIFTILTFPLFVNFPTLDKE